MNCNLSRKHARSKNLPYFCAFNRKGTCINPYPALEVNKETYGMVGLVVPACTDLTPVPVTTSDKELKPMMAGYVESAKAKQIAWPTPIVVTYEYPRNEYNETAIANLVSKSKDPGDLIEALRDHGLSYELNEEDTEVYLIESSTNAKRLMKAAHLKLDRNYKVVDEDTPEPPEKPIKIDPEVHVSMSTYPGEFKEEEEE